jgi:hypothetical protein
MMSIFFTLLFATSGTTISFAADSEAEIQKCARETKEFAIKYQVRLKQLEAELYCMRKSDYSYSNLICGIEAKKKWANQTLPVDTTLTDNMDDCKVLSRSTRKCMFDLAEKWNNTRGTIRLSKTDAFIACSKYTQGTLDCATKFAVSKVNKLISDSGGERWGHATVDVRDTLTLDSAYEQGCRPAASTGQSESPSDANESSSGLLN